MNESTISHEKGDGRDGAAEGRPSTAGETAAPPAEGDWQETARAFSRARLRLYGFQTAAGLLLPFLFWYLGGAGALEGGFVSFVSQQWLLALLFLLAYQAITASRSRPISSRSTLRWKRPGRASRAAASR